MHRQLAQYTNQLTNVTVGIDSGTTVYPHQAGYVKLNYGFSVPNSAVKGDTFKITVPKELNFNGITQLLKCHQLWLEIKYWQMV